MIETRTNLDSLEAGKEGYIVSIECEDKALRKLQKANRKLEIVQHWERRKQE
mgnify:CR=1 FL=1